MRSNLERYKKDIETLIKDGERLAAIMEAELVLAEMKRRKLKDTEKTEAALKASGSFPDLYQGWYSEARALIRQLLPDRLDDFVRHCEKPSSEDVVLNSVFTMAFSLVRDAVSAIGITHSTASVTVKHCSCQQILTRQSACSAALR